MAFPKFQTKEVLNKVLNSGEDALNVDLSDSVTVTVDSEFPAAAAITDNFANPTTTSAMSMLMGWDTSTWDRVQIGDGTAASALRVTISTNDSHFGAVGAAADVDGVIHGQLRYIGTGVDTVETSANAIQTAVEAVNQAAEGTISSTTQRVTIATDDDGVAHLATIAGDTTSVDGKITACNTGAVVLAAGSAAIGKLAANSGVDIGDVDITSIAAGDNNIGNVDIVSLPASTNTIEVVGDAAENANAAGNPVLVGGRYDASGTNDGGLRTLGTTDVGALALDPKGVLLTKDFTGQAGSILVTGTGAIAAGYGKFIAIQFIEDTVFSSSASGLSGTDLQRWPDDTGVGSDISSNGAAIDGVTFPQGMTIFGRWDGFTLASGKVIAYIGYV
jgi:hypothetical protein